MFELESPRLDLSGLGWDHTPLARADVVEVAPPSLRDNTGLADRLARTLARKWGLEIVSVPLSVARELAGIFPAGGRVWAAARMDRDPASLIVARPALPDRAAGPAYGLAVDLGSTTLVLALVDLDRPFVLDQITLANPQAEHGADILSRVHHADRPEGRTALVRMLRLAVGRGLAILAERHHLDQERIIAAAVAGNTVMTHFYLDLPVRTIIREPYVPALNRPEILTAAQVDLALPPEAPVLVLPNKGAYFGGDLMAGLVVAGLARAEEPSFLVDVGTNAEVVLGQKDWLVGAAGAAGPALEAGVAARGMVAGPGAIDQVRIDRETKALTWRTIDGAPPRGLCGSGLIDLLAELYLSGLIDAHGKLTLTPGDPRRIETDEGTAFLVVPEGESFSGRPILFSEIEIDILTRSKAAMYTILRTVALSVGLNFGQIDRFYVAGTFGQYIDPRMAVAIGMVPDLELDRFIPLGNSSLKGAILALLSSRARTEMVELWRKLTYLEMNVNQDLMNRFSAARFIPHTDRRLFPSVGTIIK